MIFDTNIGLAVKCAHCGCQTTVDFSLFDLYKTGTYTKQCSCGYTLFSIKSNNCKSFRLYIPCIACEKEHTYIFTSKQVLSEKVKILSCPVSRFDLAFVGNKCLVEDLAEKVVKDLQELMNVLEG